MEMFDQSESAECGRVNVRLLARPITHSGGYQGQGRSSPLRGEGVKIRNR
jgi:hypothetical protein